MTGSYLLHNELHYNGQMTDLGSIELTTYATNRNTQHQAFISRTRL